ncbi:hypothetical protein [Radiobacillus sp. PE A8.2]|uniref:hypothetical protein n=1 Tax=Radiobacillus sp. PE A8.2 TaxID=3380349 RepID=UPI003890F4D9
MGHIGEKLHAFPETQQMVINVIDSQSIHIVIDDQPFSLFEGELINFERYLHLDKGFPRELSTGDYQTVKKLSFIINGWFRLCLKLFAVDVAITPVSDIRLIKIVSKVNGDVANLADRDDPKVASEKLSLLRVAEIANQNGYRIVKNCTRN